MTMALPDGYTYHRYEYLRWRLVLTMGRACCSDSRRPSPTPNPDPNQGLHQPLTLTLTRPSPTLRPSVRSDASYHRRYSHR